MKTRIETHPPISFTNLDKGPRATSMKTRIETKIVIREYICSGAVLSEGDFHENKD